MSVPVGNSWTMQVHGATEKTFELLELGLATVPVTLGARDLQQLRLYLSISKL